MNTPNTEQGNALDSGGLKPTDLLAAIEKLLSRSVELQAEMIAQLASEAAKRAEQDAKHDERLTRIDALYARYAEFRVQNEELAAETNKRFTALAISQAKIDERFAAKTELDAARDARLDRTEALQAETTEAITRLTADTEQRAKQDAARDARLDRTEALQAETTEAITRLTADTELRAKQDAEYNARLNNIAETVAELKGALTPWKLVLGGIISVVVALVISVLGGKGIEALLKLF